MVNAFMMNLWFDNRTKKMVFVKSLDCVKNIIFKNYNLVKNTYTEFISTYYCLLIS